MQNKLSVGEALNETFQFAVNRWPAILRFGWAPVVMAMLISVLLAVVLIDRKAIQAMEDGTQTLGQFTDILSVPGPAAFVLVLGAGLAILVLMSGFMANVYRLVALGENPDGLVHLRFDGPAMRVLAASVVLNILNFGLYLVALLAASLMTGISLGDAFGAIGEFMQLVINAAQSGQPVNPEAIGDSVAPFGLFGVAFVLFIIPFVYLNVRLAPFVAGSAAENRLLLMGAFQLTKGNFLPLLGYFILLFGALILLSIVFQIAVGIFDAVGSLSGGAFAPLAFIAGLISLGLSFVYQLFTMALQMGGQGIIYRRLKTGA